MPQEHLDQNHPQDVINLSRYPISDLGSQAFRDFTARCRETLEVQQYVVLDNFISPDAKDLAIQHALKALPKAHHNAAKRNCYLHRQGDPAAPDDHPRNIFLDASTRMIAADLLPEYSPLKSLYYWDNMRAMVAAIVGVPVLYNSADLLQPVNVLCYREGDRSAWHFDSDNAFTMTLMLQAPLQGGAFQMIPNIRGDDDQRYEDVGNAVLGDHEKAVEVARQEGALCIFRGCNSLHRVTPVKGSRMRIMAVFVYENEPGVIGDPEVNATVYGRRTEARPGASV
ncbi:MAG: 2OG-Fe(II) oxygenase [Pseudomonadota bacterium]